MRLGHRIYSLHLQSKDEVIYTYQRVFKYLLETLSAAEFEQLSFYSVNRLIDTIFQTKIQTKILAERKTLRHFIYSALDLGYMQTDKSNCLLNPEEQIKYHFAKDLWHSCRDIDVSKTYQNVSF